MYLGTVCRVLHGCCVSHVLGWIFPMRILPVTKYLVSDVVEQATFAIKTI